MTFLAKAKEKVGFSFSTAREWPNIFATKQRFTIDRSQNIRHFYLNLISSYFKDRTKREIIPFCFNIGEEEKIKVNNILKELQKEIILVCPGSKWPNKKLPFESWVHFLKQFHDATFLLSWGTLEEKTECEKLRHLFSNQAVVIDKLALPTLQYLMSQVDLMIGVDSLALHLCATTATPTISFFGPTKKEVFQPIGAQHIAYQGTCPYNVKFKKQCPFLRTCKTGACIHHKEFKTR